MQPSLFFLSFIGDAIGQSTDRITSNFNRRSAATLCSTQMQLWRCASLRCIFSGTPCAATAVFLGYYRLSIFCSPVTYDGSACWMFSAKICELYSRTSVLKKKNSRRQWQSYCKHFRMLWPGSSVHCKVCRVSFVHFDSLHHSQIPLWCFEFVESWVGYQHQCLLWFIFQERITSWYQYYITASPVILRKFSQYHILSSWSNHIQHHDFFQFLCVRPAVTLSKVDDMCNSRNQYWSKAPHNTT